MTSLDLSSKRLNATALAELAKKIKHNTHLARIKWPSSLPEDPSSRQALEEIRAKLKTNMENHRHHPSHYEYAVLSRHVYELLKVGDAVTLSVSVKNAPITHQLAGWKVLRVFDHNAKSGLYAAAYLNERHGHLVLAFRGTEIIPPEANLIKNSPVAGQSQPATPAWLEGVIARLQNIKNWFSQGADKAKNIADVIQTPDVQADLESISGRITSQQIEAYEIMRNMTRYASEGGYRLSTTGHSLGGWLAQLMVLHHLWDCQLAVGQLPSCSPEAVTFDSPGLDPIVEVLRPSIKYAEHEIFELVLKETGRSSTVYLTAPNPVNTAGKQWGRVYRLAAPVTSPEVLLVSTLSQWLSTHAWLETAVKTLGIDLKEHLKAMGKKAGEALGASTLLGHSMENLLQMFDRETGSAQQVKVAIDWPVVDWTQADNPSGKWLKEGKEGLKGAITKGITTQLQNINPLFAPLFTKATESIVDNFIGLLFSTRLLKVAQDANKIGGAIYTWVNNGVDRGAFDEYLKYASSFGSFAQDEPEKLKPDQLYYLRFKAHYHTVDFESSTFNKNSLTHRQADLLSAIEDAQSQLALASDSWLQDPAFQVLQERVGRQKPRVVGNDQIELFKVLTPPLSARELLGQVNFILALYKDDVWPGDWSNYWRNYRDYYRLINSARKADNLAFAQGLKGDAAKIAVEIPATPDEFKQDFQTRRLLSITESEEDEGVENESDGISNSGEIAASESPIRRKLLALDLGEDEETSHFIQASGTEVSVPTEFSPATSSATCRVSAPFWVKPLQFAGSVLGASLSGAKTISNGALGFAGGMWQKVTDSTGYMTSGMTTRFWGSTSEANSAPSHFTAPNLTAVELVQAAIPVINKFTEQYGLFGHKPLTPALAAKQERQHEKQLTEIQATLAKMQHHPLLKRRVEYRAAKEAFAQAQLRFRNYFQDTVGVDHVVTESEDTEVGRLIERAQQMLMVVEALQLQIEEHPGFVKKLEEITAGRDRAEETLRKMESTLANRIKQLQRQQTEIGEHLLVVDISKEQEATLEAEWDYLEDVIKQTRKEQEKAEPLYGAFAYLLGKVSDQLDAGCLPAHLIALQKKLQLITAALVEVATGNENTEEGLLAEVITLADGSCAEESTVSCSQYRNKAALATQRKLAVLTDFFAPKQATDQLAASAASRLAASSTVSDILQQPTIALLR